MSRQTLYRWIKRYDGTLGSLADRSHRPHSHPNQQLTAYHADIDEQAEDMLFRIVKQLAEKENVTEQLKADNQMLWVARMNNIRSHAMEIVNTELIYV